MSYPMRRHPALVVISAVGLWLTLLVGLARPSLADTGCPDVAQNLGQLGLLSTQEVADDGTPYTLWSGFVASWDGVPLSVDVTVPAAPACSLPLVSLNHGYGGAKTAFESSSVSGNSNPWTEHWNNAWFAERGDAVLTFTARGTFDSCGPRVSSDGTAAGLPPSCTDGGRHYWIALDDMRYSARDLQWLIGRLVDAGLVDPGRVAVAGGSMGGALTWELALLNDRVVCVGGFDASNGTDPCQGRTTGLATWTSPTGIPLHIAAAVPEFTWGTLGSLLTPNGRATDYVPGAPAASSDTSPIGVPVTSWINLLYSMGKANGFFEPASSTPDPYSAWGVWFQDLQQQVNTVTAKSGTSLGSALTGALYQWDGAKSPTSGYVPFDADVPVFQVQGMDDSIATPVLAEQMWHKAKLYDAQYPISVVYADAGHVPATNSVDVVQAVNDRANTFLDNELRGTGASPPTGETVIPFRCGGSASPSEVASSDLTHLEVGSVTYSSSIHGATVNTGGGAESKFLNPQTAPPCPSMSTQTDPGVASWTWSVGKSMQMITGAPVITTTLHTTGSDAELNTRLWDVSATGTQTLMSRGTYRLAITPNSPDTTVSYELAMTSWKLPAGHTLKLEITGYDAPTYQADAVAAKTTIDTVKLRLPTTNLAAAGSARTVTASAGANWQGVVAQFPGLSSTLAGTYSATVDWGDGTTSLGTVAYAGTGWYTVSADHTYATSGTNPHTVALTSADGVTVTYASSGAVAAG